MSATMVAPRIDLRRTLGPLVVEWIEANLCHGPGDVQGRPVELDDEQVRFLCAAYAIDDAGRRVVNRAVYSRPKGRAKSELAAMIVCAEALGPVRFSHWDDDGYPVGRRVQTPIIVCAATEGGQADNTYGAVHVMLTEGAVADTPGLDVGLTRTFLPGGGKIHSISARASSKDGGKETFVNFDEPLALDTPVPTPGGWATMGDLVEGDQVIGVDGLPARVLGVSEVHTGRPCYRVTFADGSSVVADASHRWMTCVSGSSAHPRVRTTEEIRTDGRRIRVPLPEPIDLPEADLPVDPYIVGYFLANGSRGSSYLTAHDQDADEVVGLLAQAGAALARRNGRDRGLAAGITIGAPGSGRKVGSLRQSLREMGVLDERRVPVAYLRGSLAQRHALLCGLMDADGHARTKTAWVEFVSASPLLADAVVELVRSFGCVPRRRPRKDGTEVVGWVPRIEHVPFRVERKRKACIERLEGTSRRGESHGRHWISVTSVEPVASVPVRCIAVDSSDHLFLAGEAMVATHNTHLFISPELHNLAATLRRNLAKRREAQAWSLETSTMYAPGQNSVAESSHRFARDIAAGKTRDPGNFLFDHMEGPDPKSIDWDDDDQLRSALRMAYGDAAEWMDLERLIADARDPSTRRADFVRYFLNRPSRDEALRWVTSEQWDALAIDGARIPAGARIVAAVDVGISNDSTAVVIAGEGPDGRELHECHVWASRRDATAHQHVAGRVRLAEIEDHLRDLAGRYELLGVAYDKMFFEAPAQTLSDEGLTMVEIVQGSKAMREAEQGWYQAVTADRSLAHNGDPVFAAHVAATVATKTDRGWKLRKMRSEEGGVAAKIDATVASIMAMAVWRVLSRPSKRSWRPA